MPKKTKKPHPDDPLTQFTFKIPLSLYGALQEAGKLLRLDLSNLLRMIIAEHISEYFLRGKKAAEALEQAKTGVPGISPKDEPNVRGIDL
jgi:hypothetical protein